MTSPICVVTGVGPGNGAAVARKFSAEGYRTALLARSPEKLEALEREIPESRGYATDVSDGAAVAELFERIRSELGPVDVLIHNAGNAVFGSFLEIGVEQLEQSWRVNTLGLFHCAREAVKDMQKTGRGAVIVTGATAALRGGKSFAAFAPAKAAQRILTQSMARELGPQGIHVAYVVVDGVIDMPITRQFMKDRPDDFFLKPEHIADTIYHLARQERSAWTFEIDLRPFGESW